jgi:hypothetical protein
MFSRHSLAIAALTLAGLALTSVSSCTTTPTQTSSMERVSSVLISADEKKIVVMTRQYHYIFDVPSPLVQALKGTMHQYDQATFSQFHVYNNGKTRGAVSIVVSNAPNEVLEAAVAAGFMRTSNGAVFSTALYGDRYGAGDVQPTKQYKLNQSYHIQVVSDGYSHIPSPVKSAVGGFALGGLILFSLPIALVSGQK